MSTSRKACIFARKDLCRHLQAQSSPRKRKYEAMKAATQFCGEEAAGRKRYKVVFVLG